MNKWWLVLKREYLFRVKKKSFIVMTLLLPLLFASFIILPAYLMERSMKKNYKVAVIDQSGKLKFDSTEEVSFIQVRATGIDELKSQIDKEKKPYDAVLQVPSDPEHEAAVLYLLSDKDVKISDVVRDIYQQAMEGYRYKQINIQPEVLEQIKEPAKLTVLKWTEKGVTKSSVGVRIALATIGALLVYFFMFMYGGLAMRSVMEEKVNRVVELIVSSVRPLELMFGKLLAILFVALTQFVVWIVLIVFILKSVNIAGQNSDIMVKLNMVLEMVKHVNLGLWIFTFVFFFLTGYLLYGSWFAAIGSAVDVETDAQQFVFPLTLPIIFAIIFLQAVIFNPDGQMAFWLSIIPFTSPIIMPVRISFGIGEAVMWWEYLLSLVLMILTVWASLWATAKVFRMGILFYGKRPTYKDLWKWIRQG